MPRLLHEQTIELLNATIDDTYNCNVSTIQHLTDYFNERDSSNERPNNATGQHRYIFRHTMQPDSIERVLQFDKQHRLKGDDIVRNRLTTNNMRMSSGQRNDYTVDKLQTLNMSTYIPNIDSPILPGRSNIPQYTTQQMSTPNCTSPTGYYPYGPQPIPNIQPVMHSTMNMGHDTNIKIDNLGQKVDEMLTKLSILNSFGEKKN
ncbi:unnamed protein product [Mytilus coruscus]|uniref:Uncharacterized protein n=1 Tax=Mytilus coruscus TaxID=42192 RepID=A0A6J8B923_MYTCO|nr:unnamed protein product [Mytilus coruscus]